MTVPTKVDQISLGISRLLEQFKDKNNINELMISFLEQPEDLESANFELLNDRNVATAIGEQLDVIGLLVNEFRGGRDDEEYRQAIYGRIFVNNSEGTPEEVMSALKIMTNATRVQMWEHYPSSVILLSNGGNFPSGLCSAMNDVLPVASGIFFIIEDPLEDTFIPSEADQEDLLLVDGDEDNIVDDMFNQFTVTTSTTGGDLSRAILPEIVDDILILEDESPLLVSLNGIDYSELEVTAVNQAEGFGYFAEVIKCTAGA